MIRIATIMVNGGDRGAILLRYTVPLPIETFHDEDDAEDFVEWFEGAGFNWLSPMDAEVARRAWDGLRQKPRCAKYDLAKGGCTGRASDGFALCATCRDDDAFGARKAVAS